MNLPIPLIAFLIGFVFGAIRTRRREMPVKDQLHRGIVYGIAAALLWMFLALGYVALSSPE